jgi:hypothetical protein
LSSFVCSLIYWVVKIHRWGCAGIVLLPIIVPLLFSLSLVGHSLNFGKIMPQASLYIKSYYRGSLSSLFQWHPFSSHQFIFTLSVILDFENRNLITSVLCLKSFLDTPIHYHKHPNTCYHSGIHFSHYTCYTEISCSFPFTSLASLPPWALKKIFVCENHKRGCTK